MSYHLFLPSVGMWSLYLIICVDVRRNFGLISGWFSSQLLPPLCKSSFPSAKVTSSDWISSLTAVFLLFVFSHLSLVNTFLFSEHHFCSSQKKEVSVHNLSINLCKKKNKKKTGDRVCLSSWNRNVKVNSIESSCGSPMLVAPPHSLCPTFYRPSASSHVSLLRPSPREEPPGTCLSSKTLTTRGPTIVPPT